jgi:hypothetical protein
MPARRSCLDLGEAAQDGRRLGGDQLLEEQRDLLVGQPLEEDGDLGRLELRDQVRPLEGPIRSASRRHLAFAFADQDLDLAEQLVGGQRGHRGSPPWVDPPEPWGLDHSDAFGSATLRVSGLFFLFRRQFMAGTSVTGTGVQ